MAQSSSSSTNATRESLRGDLIVFAGGLTSSAIVGAILWALERYFDASLFSQLIGNYLPIGAMIAGGVASLGYWFAAKRIHHRPTDRLLFGILLASIATFLLVHFLHYETAQFKSGKYIKQEMSFGSFLVNRTEHLALVTTDRNSHHQSTERLGKEGWLYAALKIGGFWLGGFMMFMHLVQLPYCVRCSRYYGRKHVRRRYFLTQPELMVAYERVSGLVGGGAVPEAVNAMLASGLAMPKNAMGEIKLTRAMVAILELEARRCGKCGEFDLKFTGMKKASPRFEDIGICTAKTKEMISIGD